MTAQAGLSPQPSGLGLLCRGIEDGELCCTSTSMLQTAGELCCPPWVRTAYPSTTAAGCACFGGVFRLLCRLLACSRKYDSMLLSIRTVLYGEIALNHNRPHSTLSTTGSWRRNRVYTRRLSTIFQHSCVKNMKRYSQKRCSKSTVS